MKKALDDPKLGIKVIDVREPFEYEIARIEGVPLLPMSELQQRFTELDPNTAVLSALQSRRALAFGGGIFARAGFQIRQERQRRHERLVGGN